MAAQIPNLLETTIGVFLHDLGKFLQRAHGGSRHLSAPVQRLESVVLPVRRDGRYTHKHALWSEEFFHWMESEGLSFPSGINRTQVRNVAVFHHKPEAAPKETGGVAHLAAEADRLSSGMERKERDEDAEVRDEPRGWDSFIKTALKSPFAAVDLGLGPHPDAEIPLDELRPDKNLMPQAKVNTLDYQSRYAVLWRKLQDELTVLFRLENPDLFCEGLLSLSERFLFAVPSSTMDQPDISLHDHSRVAAAIAAALYQWHASSGTLGDAAAVTDRKAPKLRFLAGDLSGIQTSLFLLANQQVRGVNRILRARSFLLSMLGEAALLECRREFGLPVFSQLQNAGGRFLLLLANTPEAKEQVQALRDRIDGWMLRRYRGEVALNLALSEPFAGEDLMRERLRELMRRLHEAIDEAKLRAFRGTLVCIHRSDEYESGPCQACGVRPAKHVEISEEGGEARRCEVCQDEHRIGSALPRVRFLSWQPGPGPSTSRGLEFFGGLRLAWHEDRPRESGLASLVRVYCGPDTAPGPFGMRYLANYVPRVGKAKEAPTGRELLSEEARQAEPGSIKMFEHLAVAGLRMVNGRRRGQALLGVLKADVDRLGMIFAAGLADPTISRYASLSRMMDLFFTGYLYELLRNDFPDTYTVYAGGDDLLLIGPWEDILKLAARLRGEFGKWTGGNENITLSAGVELMKVNHPVNRVVRLAEARLEDSKEAGRNRVCALDANPVTWEEFLRQMQAAETLEGYLRRGLLSQVFVYRILEFDRQRRLAERTSESGARRATLDLEAATWRARWGYQLARHVRDNKNIPQPERDTISGFLNRLLGLDAALQRTEEHPSPRIAVSIALYRNRTVRERR